MSSERSHQRRVIWADHVIKMEDLRSDDRIEVGRETGEDVRQMEGHNYNGL